MKIFIKLFTLTLMVTFLASCGGDEPVDYTQKDLSSLINKDFKGTVVCSAKDIKRDNLTLSTNVQLKETSESNALELITDENGRLKSADAQTCTNFKKTADDTAYTFDIKGFTVERTTIPEYIRKWWSSEYDDNGISLVTIKVSPTTNPKYIKATKELTFSYDAEVAVKGKINGNDKTNTFSMNFSYKVNQ